jgi:hypothetical protein
MELNNHRIGFKSYPMIIPKHSKTFQNIPKHSKTFQNIPKHSKTFQKKGRELNLCLVNKINGNLSI